MILPNIKTERELFLSGGKLLIGLDEAGRGPLAGPVVAGAAWVDPDMLEAEFEGRELVRDSKLLSEKQREKICEIITNDDRFVVGIGECSHQIIDKVNILNATFLAMRFAIEEVLEKMQVRKVNYNKPAGNKGAGKDRAGDYGNNNGYQTDESICLLVDGNRKIPKVKYEQHLFPRGDRNIFSIAAASICAKVHRDRLMDKYHEKYPQYGFDQHKGYGTALHIECLNKNGPCDIHRTSFEPVKSLILKGVRRQ